MQADFEAPVYQLVIKRLAHGGVSMRELESECMRAGGIRYLRTGGRGAQKGAREGRGRPIQYPLGSAGGEGRGG